jgi:hypothetical protein
MEPSDAIHIFSYAVMKSCVHDFPRIPDEGRSFCQIGSRREQVTNAADSSYSHV